MGIWYRSNIELVREGGGGEARVGDICDYVILKDSLDSSELLCCEFLIQIY